MVIFQINTTTENTDKYIAEIIFFINYNCFSNKDTFNLKKGCTTRICLTSNIYLPKKKYIS